MRPFGAPPETDEEKETDLRVTTIMKIGYGQKAVDEMYKIITDHELLLLSIPDATNSKDARKTVHKIVGELKKLREQQTTLLKVLGCDNMHNALLKVEKLMKKELK
jgi:mannitol-1-phosphate/altronate dehydrogenase